MTSEEQQQQAAVATTDDGDVSWAPPPSSQPAGGGGGGGAILMVPQTDKALHSPARGGGGGAVTPPMPQSMSLDEAVDRLGCGKFQIQLLWAAGLCFSADSMEVTLLSFLSAVLKTEWDLTSTQAAAITSSVFAGQLVGTLTLGRLGDVIGRRPVFLLSGIIISVFGILTAFARGYIDLLLMRTAVGFGVGGLVVPFDIMAEFLPLQQRGRYLLLVEYFWTAGAMLVPVVAYLTIGGGLGMGSSWRAFVLLCAIPCLSSFVMALWFVPESPRWLASKGRIDEAMHVLRKAAATNGFDPDVVYPPHVQLVPDVHEENSSFLELLKPTWRRLTLLIWGCWIGFAYGYYGTILIVTRVFETDGCNDAEEDEGQQQGIPCFDYLPIFISCSAELIGTTLVVLLVDRLGRVIPQAMSYLLGGFFVFVLSMSGGRNVAFATVIAFCARIFEMSATCLTWVSTAELLPTEIRTTGHSAANAVARLSAFFAPFLVEGSIGLEAVGVVMVIVHIFTACCAYRLPETKGRALGDISSSAAMEDVKGGGGGSPDRSYVRAPTMATTAPPPPTSSSSGPAALPPVT